MGGIRRFTWRFEVVFAVASAPWVGVSIPLRYPLVFFYGYFAFSLVCCRLLVSNGGLWRALVFAGFLGRSGSCPRVFRRYSMFLVEVSSFW